MKWIEPMEPISCKDVKEDTQYIHEVKWDGIRGLVYLQNSQLKIYTKKGTDRTAFYPELYVLSDEFKNKNVIFDGELIVLNNDGLPSFYHSLIRETVKSEKNLKYYQRNYAVKYIIFDVLYANGKLLTNIPLFERKQLLPQLLSSFLEKSDTIGISEVYTNGKELYQQMKQKNMEGIVSKKITSVYSEGKNHDAWFKTKFIKKMLCIIGGIQWKGEIPNSLILGIKAHRDDEKLIYIGKASLGLKESDLKLLKEYKNELMQEKCPFSPGSMPELSTTGTEIIWVIPALTCWISFLELSNDGHFRHPQIAGFSQLPAEEADGRVLAD